MAYKRARPSMRGGRRVRRRMTRRVPRVLRPRPYQLSVKRTSYNTSWGFDTVTTNGFWRYLQYDMNSFNNFSEMANVFDEYRVNAIKITFRPCYDSVQLSNTAGADINQRQSYAHYLIDPASTVAPTGTFLTATLNTFLENGGVVTKTLNRPFSIYFKPSLTDAVFNTGTGSAMVSSKRWIRTSDPSAAYRGVHVFLQPNGFVSNPNIKLDIFVTFYAQFRNIK